MTFSSCRGFPVEFLYFPAHCHLPVQNHFNYIQFTCLREHNVCFHDSGTFVGALPNPANEPFWVFSEKGHQSQAPNEITFEAMTQKDTVRGVDAIRNDSNGAWNFCLRRKSKGWILRTWGGHTHTHTPTFVLSVQVTGNTRRWKFHEKSNWLGVSWENKFYLR